MMPIRCTDQAPVPPLAYHRAQARLAGALHLDALTLITTLHLLALCRLAVRLAHRRCPPPLTLSNPPNAVWAQTPTCCDNGGDFEAWTPQGS